MLNDVSLQISAAHPLPTHNNWGSLRIVCTTACAILIDLICAGSDEVVLLKVSRGTGVTLRVAFAKRSLPRHWRVLKPDCRKRQRELQPRGGKSRARAETQDKTNII